MGMQSGCPKPLDANLASCQDDCCSEQAKEVPGDAGCVLKDLEGNDKCCSTKVTDDECGNSICCAPEPSQVECLDKPSCCKDSPSPCCDVSCLDRLALRACNGEKTAARPDKASKTPTLSRSSSQCSGTRDGNPCTYHTRTTRDTYTATLEALGCICRALVALGQQSCCEVRPRSSVKGKNSSKKRPSRSVLRTPVDSCCSSGQSPRASAAKAQPRSKKSCHTADSEVTSSADSDGCCDGSEAPNAANCEDACCAAGQSPSASAAKAQPRSKKSCNTDGLEVSSNACSEGCCDGSEAPKSVNCEDACCAETSSTGPTEKRTNILTTGPCAMDPEKGLSGEEHVILSISGMTCTGCETKLNRTLGTIESIRNLKTSLVLARAEFDLDLSAGSIKDVLKHLERTTEFKCERVANRGSNFDITVPDPSGFIKQQWPLGVTDMTVADNKTVHIAYDPKIIGVRDLVKNGWSTPINQAAPRADLTLEAGSKHVRHVGYMTLLSIALTLPVLVLAWAPLPEMEIAYGSASLALATMVQGIIAGPFYPTALKSLIFSRTIEMDLLIVLSTSAAYIFSVVAFAYLVAGHPLSTGEFFETSTLLVTLIMVGRYVSALARQKAVESVSVRSLQTSTATLVNEDGGDEMEIDARLLQYGDIFKVAPDSTIPTDGTVISGSSELDESMITGESRAVEKYVGAAVIAGSRNGSGTLVVRLTRLPGDNTITTIAGMLDEAKLSKPKLQNIADRVSSYFVPVVVALAVITFIIWIAVGIAVRKQSGADATVQAITYAITVLIVSCPCAIGLAVPMVIVIASGVAAERGVIFKSTDSIEIAYKTSAVVFDKTGTLTQGKLSIKAEKYLDGSSESFTSLLLGLVSGIKHPVSAAVAAHLKAKGVLPTVVSDQKTLTGKGVEGTSSGLVLRAGNSRWLNLSANPHVQSMLSQGYTVFCFTIDNSLAAVFGLEDSLRSDALLTVTKLRERGISIHVVSGDDDNAVRSVTSLLGIPDTNVRSRCTPGDKQVYIQNLLATPVPGKNSKKPVIMFCGDGTNDAVALAQATIGVHMNEGTDVAKSAADVVLMRPNLGGVLTTIAVSQISVNRIALNFCWSFVYNLFAILLGTGALVRVRIPPAFAGLGELVSVLPVIASAALLRWSKI